MALGRGLDSLIPRRFSTKKIADETEIRELPMTNASLEILIEEIHANPFQPRNIFSEQGLEELANSIKEHGIIQPLIISKISEHNYQLIAGERRLRAAQRAGLRTVPVIIRQADELKKLELSLIENIQRRDLGAMEKAKAYQRLMDEFNLTQEEVSKKLGKARATVANTLRLLSLPTLIQQAIEEEKISEAHAKILLTLESAEAQEAMLRRILGVGLTVREAEQLVISKRKKPRAVDYFIKSQEDKLQEILGTKVLIKKRGKKGKIIIEFYSDDDLNNLIKKLSL